MIVVCEEEVVEVVIKMNEKVVVEVEVVFRMNAEVVAEWSGYQDERDVGSRSDGGSGLINQNEKKEVAEVVKIID